MTAPVLPTPALNTTATATCPPWCDQHYTALDGTRNHSGPAELYVLGESPKNGEPLSIAVWPELRVTPAGDVYPVGVVESAAETAGARSQVVDVELGPDQLRRLAAHLLAVAAQLTVKES